MLQHQTIDVEQLSEEIKARIRALPDSSVRRVRPVRREFSRRLAQAQPQQVIELALGLLDVPGLRWVAYELVHHHKTALGSLDAETLERFGQGMDSWGDVDPFAVYLAGPAWREGQVPDALIHQWARSQSRWWRRAALACTVALNTRARGGAGDVGRTIEVCRMLVKDHDDMIVKALSWALRELVQHNPDAVRQFLDQYDGLLAARVKRELRNKLNTGLKNPGRD